MRQRKKNIKISNEDMKIILDKSIPPDVAGFMVNLTANQVSQLRFRDKYSESLRKAAYKYREKLRQKDLEKFGKPHACYNYWSEADVKYILESKDPDSIMAEKLNKTVSAIQKKREREIKRRKHGS